MILAAGRGKRLRPITDTLPKALVQVAGESLLERQLRMLADAEIRNVVINIDWLGEQIIECVGDGRRFGLQVSYSPEFGNALETAGAIQRALPMLGREPFWVVNSDVFTDIDLPMISLHPKSLGHVLLVATPAYKSRGDFDIHHGWLANGADPQCTFSGIACYRPEFFQDIPPGHSSLPPFLSKAAENREIEASCLQGVWEDVGTPQRLADVRQRFGV